MLSRCCTTFAVLSGLAISALPAMATGGPLRYVVGKGSVVSYRVRVKTLGVIDEQIEGRNEALRGEVEWRANAAPTGWAEADISGFHSGIASRDHTVAKLLGAPAMPNIRFELGRIEGFRLDQTTGRVEAIGQLTVNGHTREVRVPLAYHLGGGTLQVEGDAPLHFTDFGITPPVLGFVFKRAPDDLTIHVHLIAHQDIQGRIPQRN
jgi:polyisoprenoid-binding protein YceI